MKNENFLKKILLVLCFILVICGFIGVNTYSNSRVRDIDERHYRIDNNEITYLSILDIVDCHYLTKVNYVPNEFVKNLEKSKIIDLNEQYKFANKGTLIYVIENLDPYLSDFYTKADRLDYLLQGDNNWHLNLYIPPCFSASAIYVNSVLVGGGGSFSNYSYINYCDYDKVDKEFKSGSEPINIDLSFYTKRKGISEDFIERSKIITIHYETKENQISGLITYPIIGPEEKIKSITTETELILITFTFTIILVASLFVFICFLKRNKSFIPYIFMVLSLLLCSGCFLLIRYQISAPIIVLILFLLSPYLFLGSYGFTLNSKIKNVNLAVITFGLALINYIFTIIEILNKTITWFNPIIIAIKVLLVAMFVMMHIVHYYKTRSISKLSNALVPISICFVVSFFFVDNYYRDFFNLLVQSGIIILGLVLIIGTSYFLELERMNRYLTKNLELEVNRQTKNLQMIVDEKNLILKYISHDMKKIAHSADYFIDVLKQQEVEKENIKTLDIIKQKNNSLYEGLSEIGKYLKNDIVIEKPSIINVKKLVENIVKQLQPDCEANNVFLECETSEVKIFAKNDTLKSVIENLIFNSLEHSNCSVISIKVYKRKGLCYIVVKDNGKGLQDNVDIFKPYYTSEQNDVNTGLGLYLCKEGLEAMGGSIIFENDENFLTFIITLPAE